jgi:hypothetical protein
MFNFARDHSLISSLQFGFTPGDSPTYQLIDLYHTFCESIDKNIDVRMVFCDISKAFDTVWHTGLLFKLERLGFRGQFHNCIRNSLSNRYQRVCVNVNTSGWRLIRVGVPQGSVLGPLMFLLYINDITNNIEGGIRLFADDTCLYLPTNDVEFSSRTLNRNLEIIWDWSQKWRLRFNPTKTKSLILTRKTNKL